MPGPTSTTVHGPEGPVVAVFGEATPTQRLECYKLSATSFGWPLSEADYLEREEFLSQRPLTRGAGWKIWCLARADDPSQVLASCKTLHRDLLIRDVGGVREEQGYCIGSVITDSRYRGQGLATFLLKNLVEWLDGPGGATASMLYSSVGEFYVSRGWEMLPSFQSTIYTGALMPLEGLNLPQTRFLTKDYIPGLCERDLHDFKAEFTRSKPVPESVLMTVLPTENLITWLHDRAEFISLKFNGKIPHVKGAICETANTWVYWHHDFRKQQLTIQRVKMPAEKSKAGTKELASLLLNALVEAQKWNLPKVVVWSPTPELNCAAQFLADELAQAKVVINEERLDSDVPSVRWKSGNSTRQVKVLWNEFYAWN